MWNRQRGGSAERFSKTHPILSAQPANACVPEEATVQRREALRLLLSASSAPVLPPALLELLDHIRATTETILGSSTSGRPAPAKQRRDYLDAVDGLVLAP